MSEILRDTASLCPVCLARIPAQVVAEPNGIYLHKACHEHGEFRAIVWRDSAASYLEWQTCGGLPAPEHAEPKAESAGCPFICGRCPEHAQAPTSVAIMTTSRCNLRCPICFTDSGSEVYEPDLSTLDKLFRTLYRDCGPVPVELCGGEPTTREDLTEIISLGRGVGFDHIQINTNGLRLARERDYAERLARAGATTIYLQFDGVTEQPYEFTRGARLLAQKLEALRNCAQATIGVVLVPMVVPGVNLGQVGAIIQFAREWIPTVKGVYFQPISYFGKYPTQPRDEDRVTIPDLLNAIEEQTGGELKRSHFLPPGCEHPHCSFTGFVVLQPNGKLVPTTRLREHHKRATGVEHARQFVKQFWRHHGSAEPAGPAPSLVLDTLQQRGLFISGMAFQDVWTLDLARLERCCLHIMTADGRPVPLCAKYVSSVSGERLYPGIG